MSGSDNRAAHELYSSWTAMKNRCYSPSNPGFADYGARGIRVCQRWLDSFQAFVDDMGPRPSPIHSVDRKDNNGHYEPSNCRWATPAEQALNRRNNVRYEYAGEWLPLTEWAERCGQPYRTLYDRINYQGWTLQEAMTKSRRENAMVEVDGVEITQSEAARRAGLSVQALRYRLSRGMSIEEAMSVPKKHNPK